MSTYEKSTRPITYEDKIKIRELREQGIGYIKIGKLTGLSRDQVRGFCKRDDGGDIRSRKNRRPTNKVCIVCGIGFETTQPGRKYCSDGCVSIKGGVFKIEPFENNCAECGDVYMTTRSNSVNCSKKCMVHRKNRLNELNRRTKLFDNGDVDYDISIPKLIARDGMNCYLCKEPVDTQVHYNNDEYPNIDHVHPVSKGGTHTWDNVKLTHRKCNMIKRDHIITPGTTIQTNVLTPT